MMKTTTLIVLLWWINPQLYAQHWVSLFDGKDLKGWIKMGDSALFEVKDSSIVLHQKANTKEHSFLRTRKQYRNFILELDAKREEGFHYGILVRAIPTPDTAHVRLYGYQVKVDHDKKRRWTGGVFDDFGNTWKWISVLTDNPKAQYALKLS